MLSFRRHYPKDIGGGSFKKTLKTANMQEARIRAAIYLIATDKYITERRAALSATAERRPVTTLECEFEDGSHLQPDGSVLHVEGPLRACVSPGEGGAVRIESNLVRRVIDGRGWTHTEYLLRVESDTLFEDEIGELDCPGWRDEPIELPVDWWQHALKRGLQARPDGGSALGNSQHTGRDLMPPKSADAPLRRRPSRAEDELEMHVERWLTEGHKKRSIRNETMGVLAIWREVSEGKPLKDCGRADGIKLREHLFGLGYTSQTVQKRTGLLGAALNYSTNEYDYAGPNPFKRLVTREIKSKKRDSVQGVAFTEEDMAKVRAALPTWDDPECVLLWVLCATTGMRRGEAFLIEGEERVGAGIGLRCINIIPTNEDDSIKNDDSVRKIPIPADAIPYLPSKITGRLFRGTPDSVGKRLNPKLHKLGVTGRGKSLKSTRHRAAKLLHNTKFNGQYCPDKLRYEILGHERGEGRGKVADVVYAGLYRPEEMKPWIDVVGLGPTE